MKRMWAIEWRFTGMSGQVVKGLYDAKSFEEANRLAKKYNEVLPHVKHRVVAKKQRRFE